MGVELIDRRLLILTERLRWKQQQRAALWGCELLLKNRKHVCQRFARCGWSYDQSILAREGRRNRKRLVSVQFVEAAGT